MSRLRLCAAVCLGVTFAAQGQTNAGVGGGGAILSLNYTPNGVLFAGCDMSAVYRSTDNGNSWFLLNEHDVESPTGTFSVAVDPNNANHLFAVHPGQGVKESSSGGVEGSWTKYRPSATYDPASVGTVLTAAASGETMPTVLLGTGGGVFSIQMSGATSAWQRLGTLTLPVVKIVYVADPSQQSGQHAFAAARCPTLSCSQADGVYDLASTASTPALALPHITDLAGGNTDASHFVLYAAAKSANLYEFASGSTGWTSIPTNSACIVPNLLGLAPGSPNTVYASSNAYADVAGCQSANVVFRGSVNGTAVTWNPAYNPATISGGWVETTSTFGWGFGGGASAFAVNPANVNAAAFGNFAGVDVTTDGGATWTQKYTGRVNSGPPSTWRTTGLDVTTAWNYYRHAGRQFIAHTDIGLAVSGDGSQWRLINSDGAGNTWGNFYQLQFDDTRGISWAAVSQEHDIPTETQLDDFKIDNPPPGKPKTGAVLLSPDNGLTWTKMTSQPKGGVLPVVSIVYRASSGDLVVSVWRDGVYRSAVDAGGAATGWTRLGVMPAAFDASNAAANLHFYQLRQDSAGNLYVVVAASVSNGSLTPGALLRLAAGSSTWTRVDNPTSRILPNDFIIDPSDQNVLYVATNDEQGRSPQTGGLWKYALANGQLSSATQVLGDQTPAAGTQTPLLNTSDLENAAAFSPIFVGSMLYVATTGHGVVQSADRGASWTQAFPSLRFLRVLRVVPDGSGLWAATFGAGLWNLVPADTSFDFVLVFPNQSTGALVTLPLSL
jgi:hypothetical protein